MPGKLLSVLLLGSDSSLHWLVVNTARNQPGTTLTPYLSPTAGEFALLAVLQSGPIPPSSLANYTTSNRAACTGMQFNLTEFLAEIGAAEVSLYLSPDK